MRNNDTKLATKQRDENSYARITRSKGTLPVKTANTNGGGATKQRKALGDLSNTNGIRSANNDLKKIHTSLKVKEKDSSLKVKEKDSSLKVKEKDASKKSSNTTIVVKRTKKLEVISEDKLSSNTNVRANKKQSEKALISKSSTIGKENVPAVSTTKKRSMGALFSEEDGIYDIMEEEPRMLKKARTVKPEKPAWDDLDEEDIDDPLMASEYVTEIFEYYSILEKKTAPDPSYLVFQKDIKPEMRSILVDWLVDTHAKFRLLPETLFLTINVLDRFMSKEMVEVDRLQLLAVVALFISAKYEEVYSPSIQSYVMITGQDGFTEKEILEAERYVLQVLHFDLSYPNPMNFLRRISKADNYDIQSRTFGKYLIEISLVDHRFIGMFPSLICAAAMYLSRKILGKGKWDANLIHYSGDYDVEDIIVVCEMMMDYLVQPITHECFFKKYASKRFLKASIISRQWAKKAVIKGIDLADNSD